MADSEQIISDSVVFGAVAITRTENCVTARLESDASIVVTIARQGRRTRKKVPIGTRDPAYVRATVNDRDIEVIPGVGRLVKRTYRVVAKSGDRWLSLRPKTIDTCDFVKGKPHQVEKAFGELRAGPDGTLTYSWATPTTVLGTEIVPPEPTVEDVLLAGALAAAFGTGALSLTSIVLGLVESALPG